jgi:hypothetical protein
MEIYRWLKASTRIKPQFDIAVVVLGVVSRLVVEQCDLPSEGFWVSGHAYVLRRRAMIVLIDWIGMPQASRSKIKAKD